MSATIRRVASVLLVGVVLAAGASAALAQSPPAPRPPAAPLAPPAPQPPPAPLADLDPAPPAETLPVESLAERRDVVRMAQDYRLPPDSAVNDLVLILGTATVEGRVFGDLVVIGGGVRLARSAIVNGDLVVVGGSVFAEPGAVANGDLVTIGGVVSPAEFSGRYTVVIGSESLGRHLMEMPRWFTEGLLWGRLIVPSISWTWGIAAVLFVLYLAVGLIFSNAVQSSGTTLSSRPFGALIAGVLVIALLGPLCFILVVSVVGIAVVPVLIFALIVAAVIGKVGVTWWIGSRIYPQADSENRLQIVRSFAIGFLLLTFVYALPLLGLLTWATLSVLSLGAATLALTAAYRREAAARRPAPAAVEPVRFEAPPEVAFDAPSVSVSGEPEAPGVASSRLQSRADLPRATFIERTAALALDFVLVFVVVQFFEFDWDEQWGFFFLAYRIGMWAWKGATVGGMAAGLQIVKANGARLEFVDAFVRGLASILSFVVLGLGYLWMFKSPNPDKQTWHDMIAGTIVVKVPRNARIQ